MAMMSTSYAAKTCCDGAPAGFDSPAPILLLLMRCKEAASEKVESRRLTPAAIIIQDYSGSTSRHHGPNYAGDLA